MNTIRLVVALALVSLIALPVRVSVRAQDGGWQATGLGAPVTQLFVPSSGALLARDHQHLYRSDDAGATWREVQLPPKPSFWHPIAVAPTNHDLLFASTDGALARSTDGGRTWQRVLTVLAPGLPEYWRPGSINPIAVSVSAADPNTVFAIISSGQFFWLTRSNDQGSTWQNVIPPDILYTGSTCSPGVELLVPHWSDPDQLFATFGCMAGFSISGGHTVMYSADRGDSWTSIWQQPQAHGPLALVGVNRAGSTRLFLAEHRYGGSGGGSLLRSDDGGFTWAPILEVPIKVRDGAGLVIPMGNRTRPTAIALDPSDPDHVYASLAGVEGGVLESQDAGETWTDLGLSATNGAYDVALGVDRRNLYAATDEGVQRRELS